MTKIYTVTLPDIGEGVVEGEIIEWLKNEGDAVKQDEPVVMVMTDKATVELPSPYPGKVIKHYFKKGELSIKGKPLYDLELADGVEAKEKQVSKLKEKEQKSASCLKIDSLEKVPLANSGLALPSTRHLAKELGMDIEEIQGTGKGSRVTVEDIKNSIKKDATISDTPLVQLPGDEIVPLIGIKNLMARKMAESKRKIPHFSYFEQVDVTRLVKLRQKFKEEGLKQNIQVTYVPFLLRALVLCLKKFPQFNASVDKDKVIIHHQYNIGIAMASPLGLIVPVLKNVQDLSLIELIHAYEVLKTKSATNKLHPNDMKEGTITISNFGVLGGGGLFATPIINYPEVAILAVNRIQKQPIVWNNELAIRDVLNLSWSFDHRIIDGDQASVFSEYFAGLLANPAALL